MASSDPGLRESGRRTWSVREALRRFRERLEAPVQDEPLDMPWRTTVAALLALLALLVAVLLWRDARDPRFSWIGDEYAFFSMARDIASGANPSPPLLSANGVYDHAPVLDSFFQAQVMRVAGIDLVGWKAANIVVVVASVLLVYAVGRELFASPMAGLAAAWFLGLNHFVLGFAHIGYNNLHCLPPVLAGALFLARFLRTGSRLDLFLCGLAAGSCFYTFLSARLVLVLTVPVILLRTRKAKSLACFAGGFALLFLPFVYVNGHEVIHQMTRVSFGHSGFSRPNVHGLGRWFAGLFLPGFTPGHHHVLGPVLTAIPAVALVGGLVVVSAWLWSRTELARAALLLVWFALVPALVIVPHWDQVVPMTRLHVVVPSLALLSGLGLVRLVPGRGLVVGAILVSAVQSAVHFYDTTPRTLGIEARALLVTIASQNPSLRTCALTDPEGDRYFSESSVTFLSTMYGLGNLVPLDRSAPAEALDSCALLVVREEATLGQGLASPNAGSRARAVQPVFDRSGTSRLFVLR